MKARPTYDRLALACQLRGAHTERLDKEKSVLIHHAGTVHRFNRIEDAWTMYHEQIAHQSPVRHNAIR